ncbi:MAG: phosphoribosylformylglycinamidine synthase subunit PurS [Elusimicrobiota bacterium]|nr:phosphoribosylformylglycinamidine synthase subunit PurS [Elusimicrobiota bacterium]
MIIEVWTKNKYAKNEELNLINKFKAAGFNAPKIHLSRLYKIENDFSQKEYKKISENLLIDKITEKASLKGRRFGSKKMHKAEIWLKPSSTDVVGESVLKAIGDIGLEKPESARFGHAFYFEGLTESKARLMIETVLINDIINTYKINKVS